ncbi:MAG TPA: TonB family protein [Polyangia bacterium]|nr:TonB family protein [Polyangia bacterium]
MSLGPAAPVLLALALLAGCATPAPERRPTPPPATAAPERGTTASPGTDAPGGQVVPARTLDTRPEPVDVTIPETEYPREALAAQAQGSVILKILIDETGRVRRAHVLKDPGYGLGEAAVLSAITHFRFSPGRLHGKAVACWILFTVIYVVPRR